MVKDVISCSIDNAKLLKNWLGVFPGVFVDFTSLEKPLESAFGFVHAHAREQSAGCSDGHLSVMAQHQMGTQLRFGEHIHKAAKCIMISLKPFVTFLGAVFASR